MSSILKTLTSPNIPQSTTPSHTQHIVHVLRSLHLSKYLVSVRLLVSDHVRRKIFTFERPVYTSTCTQIHDTHTRAHTHRPTRSRKITNGDGTIGTNAMDRRTIQTSTAFVAANTHFEAKELYVLVQAFV